MKTILVLCLAPLFFNELAAYPSGAPESTCIDMVPGHSDPENSGPAPFHIVVSESNYEPNSSITVMLSKTSDTPFRGFLLQARRADAGTDQELPIGSFNVDGEANAQTSCDTYSPDGAVTHVSASDKDNITVVWTAPGEPEGNLVFKATVVEVFDSGVTSRYWLDIFSDVMSGEDAPTEDGVTVDTTTPVALDPIDTSECGSSKGCFRDPPNCGGSEECEYLLTWTVNGDVVDFEISAQTPEQSYWTAIGFSTDQNMGDDSVNDCIFDSLSGATNVQASWNTNEPNNEVLSNPNLGLVQANSRGSVVDGRIQCSFSREITITNSSTTTRNDADQIYNLTSSYYLLLGRGPASGGLMQQHLEIPLISPEMVNVSNSDNYADIGGSAKNDLVITHGSLMIFAWLVFVNFGVLMPRYYKTAWPGEELCGKQVWFQLHRPAMVLAVTLTLIAFIVIFIEVEGYATSLSGIDAAHPILGIIVTTLAIINPIMAVFRPHPGTPNRNIFNWAHFTVGTTAQVLAAVNVYLGTRLAKSDMSSWAEWVVLGCIVYHCIIEIILASHKYRDTRKRHSGNRDLALQGVGSEKTIDSSGKKHDGMQDIISSNNLDSSMPTFNSDSSSIFRTAVVVIHVIGMLAFASVLVYDLAT